MMSNVLQMGIVAVSLVLVILSTTRVIPARVIKVYIFNFLLCLLGWEVWMTYGLVGGDSEQKRLNTNTNPIVNMTIMTAGDGLIGVLQAEATLKAFGPEVFRKWDWRAFALIFSIGIVQNIAVTVILRKRLEVGKLSLAPMMPIRPPDNLAKYGLGTNILQNQEGWILQPFIFYAVLIRFHRQLMDIPDPHKIP